MRCWCYSIGELRSLRRDCAYICAVSSEPLQLAYTLYWCRWKRWLKFRPLVSLATSARPFKDCVCFHICDIYKKSSCFACPYMFWLRKIRKSNGIRSIPIVLGLQFYWQKPQVLLHLNLAMSKPWPADARQLFCIAQEAHEKLASSKSLHTLCCVVCIWFTETSAPMGTNIVVSGIAVVSCITVVSFIAAVGIGVLLKSEIECHHVISNLSLRMKIYILVQMSKTYK